MHDAHLYVLAAMKTYSTHRIITLHAHCIGESSATLFIPIKSLVRCFILGNSYQGYGQAEEVVKQISLAYMFCAPARSIAGLLKHVNSCTNNGKIGFLRTATRRTVATFMLHGAKKDEWLPSPTSLSGYVSGSSGTPCNKFYMLRPLLC